MEETNGIVTSVRLSHNPLENSYNIISDKVLQSKSEMQLELYDSVEFGGSGITLKEHSSNADYKRILSGLIDSAGIKQNAARIGLAGKKYETVARELLSELSKAAELLLRSFFSGAPIVVRFHNDGDGSAGGIALFRALSELQARFFMGERNVSWQMNKSIAYTVESFYADKMLFDSYSSIEKPLIIITDFGTSTESLEAIKLASKSCNLIWLDHHLPYEGFPKELITHYINVFDFNGDSNFTAGLLTCIFSEILSGADVEDLKGAALISDYSTYADFQDSTALKNSVILDYLTSTGRDSYGKPKQMDLIIKDREKRETTFSHAMSMLEEAMKTGISKIKSYKSATGISVYVLDFGHVAKLQLDYPLPGRYSSKLQDHMEKQNNGRTITIVHYGNYISARISADISDEVNLLKIIDKLKESSNGTISGGGHKQAASIRAGKENINEVMSLFMNELGVSL